MNKETEDDSFWAICPVCGEDAVISDICTECGACLNEPLRGIDFKKK